MVPICAFDAVQLSALEQPRKLLGPDLPVGTDDTRADHGVLIVHVLSVLQQKNGDGGSTPGVDTNTGGRFNCCPQCTFFFTHDSKKIGERLYRGSAITFQKIKINYSPGGN